MSFTAEDVKSLRDKTGAGMMACKEALKACNGNIDEAVEYLRKKGIASADKKTGRATGDGLVEAYIHMGGKLGVMIEVNCETDFVARTEQFKGLVKELAMQVAASNPTVVSREQVPAEMIEKEKDIYREQVRGSGKPENVVEKIVGGKLDKFYSEICLLEQPYIKEPQKNIDTLIKETIAKLGENITVKRFVRFRLGE
ncbi:MAG: translation elongation factor Ts [Candidatus Edwardsbacteria bacterium RIFOXYD12_FULL_50_11]|jgi:elongation factor Ts|uniref:Elongation factor Ts n=1 Tax=Candidatus Edwardsbacteria bacterium GWF2_54_11 TaxID=1817851 RepID=A0A1F5R9W3_9BACT|nr:MAG: translation elongation factor Ts [Candidatus Edwardsbacteria bacterium RifOxyC12_full_54_24]OGF06621.1 MAG: translation elongation factor Ts [Candidatus Edwardsbacteria bacterium RifOxyA12_full_54_48]OGF11229.1 MAG: translation elongation factor Ts [Candidatus Edwardsbacteria bacterium GWF2_54_11]OGF11676.1 MAG: translation elongation factor Ts [Candidatus Edwardsbacteria bacterium GWE2_54_12]OGF17938.1 MAG: translation elongation factor Ts [Candidatus Edwardsbacteria bacterium RIFOXYD1